MVAPAVLSWLLSGDPAIRWQVMQDLQGAPTEQVQAMRQRVATDGWGARLLAAQDPDGRWAGGLYSPKWTSTTYTLLLLHWLGLPGRHPQAVNGCRKLWDGAVFFDGGLTLAKSVHQPEACITSMLVLLASYFGYPDGRIDPAVQWLRAQQLADGGWNCDSLRSGSQHGSFHTSISVLDALIQYQNAGGKAILSKAPALPLAPHRCRGQSGDAAVSVPTAMAFRCHARTRALPARRGKPGSATGSGSWCRPKCPTQRRDVAGVPGLSGQDLVRDGIVRAEQMVDLASPASSQLGSSGSG